MGDKYTLTFSHDLKITGCSELMKIVFDDKNGEITKAYLKQKKLDINFKNNEGWTALMIACRNSNSTSSLETVKVLIEEGSDLNLQNNYGLTALMLACYNSNKNSSLETVKTLIKAGSDLNLQNKNGFSALMLASRYSNTESSLKTVEALIKAGSDLDLQNKNGWTALMMASRYSNNDSSLETVEALINAGSDLDLQNKEGLTAFELSFKDLNQRKLMLLFESKNKKMKYTLSTNDCPICLTKMENPYAINCGHVYCQKCLLNIKNRCSLCKTSIKTRLRIYI